MAAAPQNSSTADYEPYYVPESSKMAFFATIGLVTAIYGVATAFNDMTFGSDGDSNAWFTFFVGLAILLATLFYWFRMTIRENMAGMNSAQLKRSYVMGMQWFIFSEVMFFAAFFGALFYMRNLAGPWLAGQGDASSFNNVLLWPGFEFSWPMMETPQQAAGGAAAQVQANTGTFSGPERNMGFPGWSNIFAWLPLWNTIILLSSSATVHVAHLGLKEGNRKKLNLWLGITVALGIIFVGVQVFEYYEAYAHYGLTLETGAYGTTFFMLTGFHGFHVFLGMTMLLIQWLRSTTAGHFTKEDHFGFEASSWYWHFVDVVWVGLFLFVYII